MSFDVEAALNGLAALVSTQMLEVCGPQSTCLPSLEPITAIGSTLRSHIRLIGSDRPEPEVAATFVGNACDFIGAVAIMPDAPSYVAGVADDEFCWWQRPGCALPSDVVGQHVTFAIVSQGGQNAVSLRLRPAGPESTITFDDQASPDVLATPSPAAARVKVAVVTAEFCLANLDLMGQSEERGAALLADARDATLTGHSDSPPSVAPRDGANIDGAFTDPDSTICEPSR